MEDVRPKWCSEVFPSFRGSRVLELGPADGYNTAALERLGADVTAIEGNADAFVRCLILKNALGLKAKFMLGDFTQGLGAEAHDTIYASGVLYHLEDPIGFLESIRDKCTNLFLWTHFFEKDAAATIDFERDAFASGETKERKLGDRTYTYHLKTYNLEHVGLAGYIGGLNRTASWLSKEHLFGVIAQLGYKVLRVQEDRTANQMPAVNIFATCA
jgi:protein-L-isoaspartate O-methyltransferase